jgi:hypothetical protein
MAFEFQRFIRGKLRNYLCWAALLALPWVVRQPPDLLGICCIFFGAALRAYASGFLDKEGRLTIAGPFAFVRNPLYLGTLLMVCGVAESQDAWVALALAFVFGLSILHLVSLAEEKVLAVKFPNTFPRYRREVPRFFPRLTKFASYSVLKHSAETRAQQFSPALFLRNRGYEALATGAGLVVLLFMVNALVTHVRMAVR